VFDGAPEIKSKIKIKIKIKIKNRIETGSLRIVGSVFWCLCGDSGCAASMALTVRRLSPASRRL